MTDMTRRPRNVRIQLTIAFMCAAMLVYLVLLGRAAVLMISSGRAVAIALGGALLILPAIGLWAMIATLRAGLAASEAGPPGRRRRDGTRRERAAATAVGAHRTRRGRRTVRHRPCRTATTIRTTGVAGIGWPAPTTTPEIEAVHEKP